MLSWNLELGATVKNRKGTAFTVWAPRCEQVDVHLFKGKRSRLFPMQKDSQGYFHTEIRDAVAGDRYFYRLDGKDDRPDPVSRLQAEGVHGASRIVDPRRFRWTDSKWKGIPFASLIFYEMHPGTFTPEGTFEAAVTKIPYLKKLGVTCVEIMPVAQFPGKRNWGYDGVGLYAVQDSYGGPDGLKKFINACHRAGLAVCMDVVYNHLGPEGNYLHGYGPYFTKKYHTPWGDALNYDDAQNEGTRRFVIENSLFWITEYHIDALRLDAIHGIFDQSPKPILQELNEKVQAQALRLGRQVFVIAESDLNDSKIIRPLEQQGYALAGQWSDDFHHAAHAYLTGERGGYYADFERLDDLAKSIREGFVYDGKYSNFRKREHGNVVKDLDPRKLVTCVQNHDQVGNRAFGDRLSALTDFKGQKLAAVLLLLSPNTPLIFMGQEYGEKAPFQYFIDHGDPDLVRAVQKGRKKEFEAFGWKEIPDPDAEKTFQDSKLRWNYKGGDEHGHLWQLYKDLIQLRKKWLEGSSLKGVYVHEQDQWLALEFSRVGKSSVGVMISFRDKTQTISKPFKAHISREILSTEHSRYGGKAERKTGSLNGELRLLPRSAWVGESR